MQIFVCNPNSSRAMTALIDRSARAAASPGTRVVTDCAGPPGPPGIEGHHDEALAVLPMLAALHAAEAAGARAHVIACLDDPGLGAAREVVAGLLAARHAVVTTLPRAIPIIEGLALRYGAGHALRRVRAVDLPVPALKADPARAEALLRQQIEAARTEDGAEAVILGCAGMSEMCGALSARTGMPVIDGVHAAVRLAEALAGGGYRTAKTGAYAWPRDKSGDIPGDAAAHGAPPSA
jgi:allantoin racemase